MTIELNSSMEQSILDVAEELFLNKGFALTTTTEIAKRVGCNQALIHYYFRTKENLFEKIFEKKFILFITSISIDQFKGNGLKYVIERFITKHLEMLSANPKLPFLIINEVNLNPEKFKNVVLTLKSGASRIFEEMDEILKKEIEMGNIRQVSALDLILNILSLNLFMFISSPIISAVGNIPPQDYIKFTMQRKDEIFNTIWNGISIK